MGTRFIAVIGHEPDLLREDGVAVALRGLGAAVRTLDLWDEPGSLFQAAGDQPRVVVVEAGARPDLAVFALRSLRRDPRLEDVGAIVAVSVNQVARVEPSSGFDDFTLVPVVPAELYARVRAVEWRRSEFANDERIKVGSIVIDRAAHEVTVGGTLVVLTAREFSLLVYLCDRRGRLVTRRELLSKVWGTEYEGGARTVDIHVRRLRAKLGGGLPLLTMRGAGYKLSEPEPRGPRDEDDDA